MMRNNKPQFGDMFGDLIQVRNYKAAPPKQELPQIGRFAALGQQIVLEPQHFTPVRSLSQKKERFIGGAAAAAASANVSDATSASSHKNSAKGSTRSIRPVLPFNTQLTVAPQPILKITPCQKNHRDCQHRCGGVEGETRCLPCLEPECIAMKETVPPLPAKDDLCNICYTSEISSEPAVKLGCGHIFHANCVKDLLKHRWSTLRISFEFMACPACKTPITKLDHCPPIQAEIKKVLDFKAQVEKLATKVSTKEDLVDMGPIKDPSSEWYRKAPTKFVMKKCAFYQCHSCSKPYYGGQIDCERDLQAAETTTKEDLICKACQVKQIGGGQYNCPKHGHKYITWKCHKCCREALYFCFGTTYFCKYHHDENMHGPAEDCGGVNCPLGVPHPRPCDDPKKSAYPLGCSLCRVKTNSNFQGAALAIEEVKLEEEKKMVDNSELYARYNPLMDKV